MVDTCLLCAIHGMERKRNLMRYNVWMKCRPLCVEQKRMTDTLSIFGDEDPQDTKILGGGGEWIVIARAPTSDLVPFRTRRYGADL
jgi:hypothetical protein